METSLLTIANPGSGATASVTVPEGQAAAFGFEVSDISNINMTNSGGLEISLVDGGTVVIENFEALAKSGVSIPLADGTPLDLAALGETLGGFPGAAEVADAAQPIVIGEPSDNVTREVSLEPGQKYVLDFDLLAPESVDQQDGQLTIRFENGGAIVLSDPEQIGEGELPPALTLADGSVISAEELITTIRLAKAVPEESLYEEVAPQGQIRLAAADSTADGQQEQTADSPLENLLEEQISEEISAGDFENADQLNELSAELAQTEPAGGDELASIAERLAQVEPAAGPGGGGAGGRGGFGFQSEVTPVAVGPIDAIGPLGPTALRYAVEFPTPEVRILDELEPPPPLVPPTLLVNGGVDNAEVYEDGSVFVPVVSTLDASNPANTFLTLTVTGVDPSWNFVGAGWVATGNPGEYQITLPALTDYNGGFTFTPPAQSDIDLSGLNVTATAVSPDSGQTASVDDGFGIIVDAVADLPQVDGTDNSGLEDQPLAVNITGGLGVDTDGSESVVKYEISGVPAGFTLNNGTNLGGGVWALTPADLAGLEITPPANFFGSVNLAVTIFNTEIPASDAEFDSTNDNNQATDQFVLEWKPVADPPELLVNNGADDVIVDEDGSVTVPVVAKLNGADSPNAELTVVMTGIDAGWGVIVSEGVYDAAAGTWTVTKPAGQDFSGTITFAPPADSDVDMGTLNVTATAYEPASATSASSTDDFTVTTDAVADIPTVEGQDDKGLENTALDVDLSASVTDTDGSETITKFVVTDPTDSLTFSAGTETAPGVWEFTPAQIVGLTATAPTDFVGSVNLTVTAYAEETNLSDLEPDTADNVATNSDPFTLTWLPDLNPPVLNVNNMVDDAQVKEDGSVDVPVTAQFDGYAGEIAGDEVLTLTLSGVGPGWTVDLEGEAGAEWTLVAPGTYSITLPAGAEYDGKFTFAPPADSDIDLSGLSVSATVYDPVLDKSASSDDGFNIIVDAVADEPTLTATTPGGEEGTTIPLNVTTAVTDLDGSEAIDRIEISGLPTGATLTAGTESGGVWTLLPSQLAGLGVRVPDGVTGDYTLTVKTYAIELVPDDPNDAFGEYDFTDNTAMKEVDVRLTITPDDVPQNVTATETVDETALQTATIVEPGTVTANFGSDTPGTFAGNGNVVVEGSVDTGTLRHNGTEVTISFDSTTGTYTGTAGTTTVFDLVLESDGDYVFKLYEQLDHADPNNDNDQIAIKFGVTATDSEGDTANGFITVNVKDDAPSVSAPPLKMVDEDGLSGGPVDVSGSLSIDFGQDVPGDVELTGTVTPSVPLKSGGADVTVTVNGDTYVGTANGATVFELAFDNDGDYTFTLYKPLDHATGSNQLTIGFGVNVVDFDGDDAGTTVTIKVVDDLPTIGTPVLGKGLEVVDETDFGTVLSATGDIAVNYGADGPGSISINGSATSSTGLFSNGDAVTMSATSTGYVGTTAGGTKVFEIAIESDGDYTYQQFETLDHPNTADHDDVISLQFGFTATDSDGDSANGTVTVKVHDDGVTANDDTVTFDANIGVATGNVTANDDPSNDEPNLVTEVSFGSTSVTVPQTGTATIDGDHGRLQIAADGSYTYTLFETKAVQPVLLTDVSSGTRIEVTAVETASGVEFSVKLLDGQADLNGFFLDIGGDGGPIYWVGENSNNMGGVSGGFDYAEAIGTVGGSDPHVTEATVSFDGLTLDDLQGALIGVRATSVGANGQDSLKLVGDVDVVTVIEDCAEDSFTYTYTDGDGDSDTASLKLCGKDLVDDKPMITGDYNQVDETNLGPLVITDAVNVDFGSDAPGSLSAVDFSAGGSLAGGTLTHQGEEIVVTATSGGYVGTATVNGSAIKVFEFALTDNDGGYEFRLHEKLDHANGSNPNDVITLSFDMRATDYDGDTATSTISVDVLDDAPVANDDTLSFDAGKGVASGNVVANDNLSEDVDNLVTAVRFGTTTVAVPGTGSATIDGNNGTLEIFADGSYTYTLDPAKVGGTPGQTYSWQLAASDTVGTQESISKNGITISVANSGTFDIAWVDEGAGGGIGIDNLNASDSKKVWPQGEAFNIDFANEADTVTLTIADLGSNNNDGTYGLDYVLTLKDGTTVSGEQQYIPGQIVNGKFTFTIDSGAYGQTIDSITIKSVGAGQYNGASFTLNNVSYTTPGEPAPGCPEDEFTYVLTDGDGDSDTATLNLKGICPVVKVGENVDDAGTSTTDYRVGTGKGTITGSEAGDILVGDVGGATSIDQVKDYNVVLILDVSGSMDRENRISLLKQAVNNLLADFNGYTTGDIKVHIVPFADKAQTAGTFMVTEDGDYADAVDFINAFDANGRTNYESALKAANSWLAGGDPITGAETITYFVSDGEPNNYIDDSNGRVVYNDSTSRAMGQITGSDGSDEVGTLQSLSDEVVGVGIDIGSAIANLDVIDSDGDAINVDNPADLDSAFQSLNPLNQLADVGDDVIEGGSGEDLIFGDSLNTDTLAASYDIDANPGAGWAVFEQLEAGESTVDPGWSRADTVAYIRANGEELAQETTTSLGARDGGNDILKGGAGNDMIFGQEGDDVIVGGAGDDQLWGGSGSDRFLFESVDDGFDTINDFSVADGDVLDLEAVLFNYDPTTEAIEDFVFTRTEGGNTIVSVDVGGSGNAANAVDVASLKGVNGAGLDDIVDPTLAAAA